MAFRIQEIARAGYRALRAIRFPVGQLTVFVGANGVGITSSTWIEGLRLYGEFGEDDDERDV